jgi:hypothetical protein
MGDLPFVTQRMEAGARVFFLTTTTDRRSLIRRRIFRRNIVLGLPSDQIRQVKGALRANSLSCRSRASHSNTVVSGAPQKCSFGEKAKRHITR